MFLKLHLKNILNNILTDFLVKNFNKNCFLVLYSESTTYINKILVELQKIWCTKKVSCKKY